MRVTIKNLVFILLLVLVFKPDIYGCRYTVREIGFTDINKTEFQIKYYINKDVSKKKISSIEDISYATFFDTNIKWQIIHDDQSKNMKIVFSHNEVSLDYFLDQNDDNFEEDLFVLLENFVSSPIRSKLLDNIVPSFALIMMIEGENSIDNQRVETEIQKAISDFRKIEKHLPKTKTEKINVINLKFDDRKGESIFLQTLKITEPIPHIVVFYGRGRRMGPILSDTDISSHKILNLVSVIGADCECGLDLAWKLGPMIPLRWNQDIGEELVKYMGFDVENPVIKSEMSKILSIDNDKVKNKIDNPLHQNVIKTKDIDNSNIETDNNINNNYYHLLLLTSISIIVIILLVFSLIIYRRKTRE